MVSKDCALQSWSQGIQNEQSCDRQSWNGNPKKALTGCTDSLSSYICTYYLQPNARITAGQKWLLAEYVRVGKNPAASR